MVPTDWRGACITRSCPPTAESVSVAARDLLIRQKKWTGEPHDRLDGLGQAQAAGGCCVASQPSTPSTSLTVPLVTLPILAMMRASVYKTAGNPYWTTG
jgi:hypothetical protein